MSSPNIGFVCGSLRTGSINQKLQNALIERFKATGANTHVIDLGSYELPLFHGDLDVPESVNTFVEDLKDLDGVVIISPEYNGGLPPLLKNAIDWSSTVSKKHLENPVYGISSCTPGPMSGIMCMRQINYILMRLGAEVLSVQVGVGNASKAFNEKGELTAQPSSDLANKMRDGMLKRIQQKAG